jgi:hypothetical protein
MRNEQERAQQDGQAPPPQRLGVFNPESSRSHRRRYRTRVRRAPLLLLALALAAGCGGGGGSERLSRAEYAKRADAICGKFNRQTKDLKVSNMSELVAAVDKVSPVLDKALEELRTLRPPEDEQAKTDQWLAQIAKLKSDLKDIRAKASANDLAGVQTTATAAAEDNAKGNQLAAQLGMSVCSQG